MKKSTHISVVFAVFAGFITSAGPVSANSIETELKGLLISHPKIRVGEKTLESRRATIKETKALFLPKVDLLTEAGPEVIDNPSTRSSTKGDPNRSPLTTAKLTVTQNLFDGQKTASQVRSATINREIASISLEGTRQTSLFEGVVAYINVLRQRRLKEMALENERTILRQLNLEDERVRRGSGVNVDVLQAKSRLQIAKERRVGFEGALLNAISSYEQVFGHAPNLPTMIDPSPPAEVIPSNLKRATDIALMENPALLSGASTMEMSREKRRETRSQLFPVIDLIGTANYEKGVGTTNGIRRDYGAKVSANWVLFSGGSTLNAMERTNFDYRASMDNYDFLTSKIIEQTRVAWQTLVTARERKELLGNAVNIASEVFDSRKKLRDAGKETVINVLDAENEVNNAQINYTTSSYDARMAIYQLLLAMGRLMPEYMISER